jgi:hypothetical protein
MKVLIFFDESTDVKMHEAEIESVPLRGDFLWLPDVSSRGLFPVERVVFLLTRPHAGTARFEVPSDSPQVKIYLGSLVEEKE